MSNKKFAKRIKKNQSNNYPTTKTWNNGDGSFTTAIPVPQILVEEKTCLLLLHMAKYVYDYMERENISSPEKWDIMADNEDFKWKTFTRVMNDYCNTCYLGLNIDMIEYAPIFLNSVIDLMNHKREWCDGIVTKNTNFKYEWLPILHAVALLINRNIKLFALEYIEFRKKQNEKAA